MRLPRLVVAVVLALSLGAGGALGLGAAATSGAIAASSGPAKARAAAAAKRAKASPCTTRRRARLRRCRPSYRMSGKRLRPIRGLASIAAPGGATQPATPAPPAPAAPDAPVAPPPPPPILSTLGANAYDMSGFVLRLTKTTVPAGNLTVFFTNHDVSDHNLWIEGPGGALTQISDAIGENASANKTVAVTAGTWRLFCSLPEHEAMTRDLTVTAAG